MVHLFVESFKGVLAVNDREISLHFDPLIFDFVFHICFNTSFLCRDIGKKFGIKKEDGVVSFLYKLRRVIKQ